MAQTLFFDVCERLRFDRSKASRDHSVRQVPGGGVHFIHPNHLGSTAMITKADGSTVRDLLFYPWGQLWQNVGSNIDAHFAAFQQTEFASNNLHPTPNRMYHPRLYRWQTPDPLGGDVTDPQSLNRYAYVLNNPANFIDPLGLDSEWSCTTGSSGTSCTLRDDPYDLMASLSTVSHTQAFLDFVGQIFMRSSCFAYIFGGISGLGCFGDGSSVGGGGGDSGQSSTSSKGSTVSGASGSSIDYFNLRLTATGDSCGPTGRSVDYQLTTRSGAPVTSPNFYVYEIQSAQALARGGPFPGTTVGKNFNSFNDWISGLGTGRSTQQFGVSLAPPNASGVPGGHLVMINWSGSVVGQNIIRIPAIGRIVINGKPCP